ncbi:MAG: hypothetical protein JNM62_11935 [Flavobacteriales bacterium]|nr:hypothetical protein [Flavobacteriales bacterium]
MLRFLRWVPLVVLPPLLTYAALREEMPPSVVIPSVFRWRNAYWLEGEEAQAIQRDQIQRVYMKLLDIDWNSAHGAHPVSSVNVPYQWKNYSDLGGEWTDRVELVPCIYITNNTFLKISEKEVDELAANLLRKLRMECPVKIHGVMVDCDWSAKTKAKFFRLTRIMNDSLDLPLTATIRLHQYAQPKKSGVPPADRGMLMPYNVGNITAPGNVNSIFDRATAEPYFASTKPYPLPLDIGLPAFSWGVQFRKGAFVGILKQEQVYDAMNAGLLSGETHGVLQVVNEDNKAMPELHLGDEIRTETITPELIAQVTELARTAVNSDTLAVAYFEAGASTFQRLAPGDVKTGFTMFGTLRYSGYYTNDTPMDDSAPVTDTAWIAPDTAVLFVPIDTTER